MLQVLSVVSEIFPLIKTGGLADVAGALPPALAREGVAVRSLVPGYPAVMQACGDLQPVHAFADLFGGPATLLEGTCAGLDLFVLDAPHLYARAGGPYGPSGRDWPDNAERFAALSWVGAVLARGAIPGFAADIVHAHDWQAGLVPAYLAYDGGRRPQTVITVHNLAHQGAFPPSLLDRLRLPPHAFSIDGVEYYGEIGFLKAGLYFADAITTVSPAYAAEIQTPEGGMGLDGLLRARAGVLRGILNGIDESVWDPASDPHVPARFDRHRPAARLSNKGALQQRLRLDLNPEALLFGVVSRLSWQKGLDLLLAALPRLLACGGQLALLGAGDSDLELEFAKAQADNPGRIGIALGFDESLARLIQAGSDALLVPSRFEPCGLTQLCALRYGAIPVVARVGGLADTVIDANADTLARDVATGIQFWPVTQEALEDAIERTAALRQDGAAWRQVQAAGLRAEVGWSAPARGYAELYRSLTAR